MPANCTLPKLPTMTDADLLAAVRFAIMEITLKGQSYAFDGMNLTRANLEELRKLETDLQNRVAAAGSPSGGVKSYQVIF